MQRRKYIVGNWKMHGLAAELGEVAAVAEFAKGVPGVDAALCLPATLLTAATAQVPGLMIGAQDCDANPEGARTGCLSARMLADAGAKLCIVGHSERRAQQGETDASTCAKALAAHRASMDAIVCVGESAADHASGRAIDTVLAQIAASVPAEASPDWLSIAYEPVWAVGTGKVPTPEELATVHHAIREALRRRFGSRADAFRLLYGGSMTGTNAAALLSVANVDGGLIGGASLTAAAFNPIIAAAATVG